MLALENAHLSYIQILSDVGFVNLKLGFVEQEKWKWKFDLIPIPIPSLEVE